MYWWYGTTYNVLLIDALQTALHTDWDLTSADGFDNTAAFRMHAISPDKSLLFNYADSREEVTLAPALFWLARQYQRDEWADFQRVMFLDAVQKRLDRRFTRLVAFNVAWYTAPGGNSYAQMPLHALFRGKGDVAMMRSDWEDPNALYVAVQGVWNQAPHTQLDQGSFVLDADGVRWVRDLGGDSYSLPDYWDYREGGTRWTYFRSSNFSHNTLVMGGRLQRTHATARVVSYLAEPTRWHAVMDLSETYEGQVATALRGIAMIDRSRILVQDDVELLDDTTSVRWAVMTDASVTLDGASALLRKGGKSPRAEILSPAGARFEVLSTNPGDERQNDNRGTVLLATTVRPASEPAVRLAVLLSPVGPQWADGEPPVLTPVSTWGGNTLP
jgi:hypothetical protein